MATQNNLSETRPTEQKDSKEWTTNAGGPVANNTSSETLGTRGPVLLEDYHLLEKLANFDRERIPERVVHARGATAKGVFKVTQDVSDLTCADFLSEVGKETPLIARFSTVIHERGSPEHLRDVRGFSVKMYTQQGNWDLVGNNMPVFFIRDGIAFPDMVHALKPNPVNHIQEWWRIWDFFAQHPESLHTFSWLLDDVGIPSDYRHMPGFGVHTFKFVTSEGRETYVKFHWICDQGEKNITTDDEAVVVGGTNQQHATQDLYEAIESGEYPSWTLKVQTMDPATENDYSFDPLDSTKIWPEEQFPLREVGRMVLNENPENFFNENESLAFSPSLVVPGIDYTNDKLLQTRLFSYADAQRYRLGSNYLQLPVNAPKCPFHNNNFDGTMNPVKRTGEVNYFPSLTNKEIHEAPRTTPMPQAEHENGVRTKEVIHNEENFKQAGDRFRNFDPERQQRFVMRVVGKLSLPRVTDEMRDIWVQHWTKADESLGERIAQTLKQVVPGPPSVPVSAKEVKGSQGFGLPKLKSEE